jgi:hypothetical protein
MASFLSEDAKLCDGAEGSGGAHFAPFFPKEGDMHITLNRSDREEKVKTGIFSSKMVTYYFVSAKIEFSEVELAVIKKRHLGDAIIYTRDTIPGGTQFPYNFTIDQIVKNHSINDTFFTPIEANNFEKLLKSELLPTLKDYIDGNADSASKSETFEL